MRRSPHSLVSAHMISASKTGSSFRCSNLQRITQTLRADVRTSASGRCSQAMTPPHAGVPDYSVRLSEIAPESAGNLFDGTEIDEILWLRILTLTERRKPRSGDRTIARANPRPHRKHP